MRPLAAAASTPAAPAAAAAAFVALCCAVALVAAALALCAGGSAKTKVPANSPANSPTPDTRINASVATRPELPSSAYPAPPPHVPPGLPPTSKPGFYPAPPQVVTPASPTPVRVPAAAAAAAAAAPSHASANSNGLAARTRSYDYTLDRTLSSRAGASDVDNSLIAANRRPSAQSVSSSGSRNPSLQLRYTNQTLQSAEPQKRDAAAAGAARPPPPPHEATDFALAGTSVDDGVDLLHAICNNMGGRVRQGCVVHCHTIRASAGKPCSKGVNGVAADLTTRFGSEVTVAFFPDAGRKVKQMRVVEKNSLKEFMPAVQEHRDEHVYRDTDSGLSVRLPAHIYLERCQPLRDAICACTNARELLHETFTVCQHLTRLLQVQHRRSICVRDICVRNVVRSGSKQRWTLLELCNMARIGVKSDSITARSTPPEMAEARMGNQAVAMTTAFDLWQMGTFLYELTEGHPYWPASVTDLQVFHVLATPALKLPHEERPVSSDVVQRIITKLLTRRAEDRIDAEALKAVLDSEERTGTLVRTVNVGRAVTETAIELSV